MSQGPHDYSPIDAMFSQEPADGIGSFVTHAMFPPQSVHDAAMIHGLGIDPINARLVDTRTPAGFGLAAMNFNPVITAFLNRLR